MQIGLYVLQIYIRRFARKTSEWVKFIVTMFALVFWLQACVAFRLWRKLSDVHAEKSGASSTSFRNGKELEG